jgi:hypothetical protein
MQKMRTDLYEVKAGWPARNVLACHRKQGEIQFKTKFSLKKMKKFHLTQSMRIVFLGMERNQPVSLVIWAVL